MSFDKASPFSLKIGVTSDFLILRSRFTAKLKLAQRVISIVEITQAPSEWNETGWNQLGKSINAHYARGSKVNLIGRKD